MTSQTWREPSPVTTHTGWVTVDVLNPVALHRSEGHLQFVDVPLVHAVVTHKLIRAGKLLLTAGPATGKGLLTWDREQDREMTRH